MALLEVKNLRVHFTITSGIVEAVDGITFSLEAGETMGLVGESGCGKTTTGYAITRLLPENGDIVGGEIVFDGHVIHSDGDETQHLQGGKRRRKLRALSKRIQPIRWKEIAMIFQGAMNAFNPVYRVGDQIMEALLLHHPKMTKAEAKERVRDLFEMVGIDTSRIVGYPHEFSGGMKQRAMIAMALSCNPRLIIADEPTTALDVIMQDRILAEIKHLQRRLGLSMIIITHDISVVAEVSDKVAIMYAGRFAEFGDVTMIFQRPAHPYSIGLLGAYPSIYGEKRKLLSIPGAPPDLANPPSGCRFHPRCQFTQDICRTEVPALMEVEPGHNSACHFAREVFEGRMTIGDTWVAADELDGQGRVDVPPASAPPSQSVVEGAPISDPSEKTSPPPPGGES